VEGEFMRRYVPELKGLDKKYIYEPWKAPIQDRKMGARMQGDGSKNEKGVYPKHMFAICLEGVKKAY
jgi:cryptochrome